MDSSVEEARAKLAQRFGKVQLGGKGTVHAHSIWDRQRLQLPALLWISILCKARDLTVFFVFDIRYPETSSEEDPS